MGRDVENKLSCKMGVADVSSLSHPSEAVLGKSAKMNRPDFLKLLVKDALERASKRDYLFGTMLGMAEEFSDAELSGLDIKFIVRDGTVYLTVCSLDVHQRLASRVTGAVADSLNSAIDPAVPYEFSAAHEKDLDYRHPYVCTRKFKKVADGSVDLFPTRPDVGPPESVTSIISEVSYRNESFNDILIEGHELVGHFAANKLYSILVYVKENSRQTAIEYLRILVVKKAAGGVEGIGEAALRTGSCLNPPFPNRREDSITTLEIVHKFPDLEICHDAKYSLDECLDRNILKRFQVRSADFEVYHGVGLLFRDPFVTIDLTEGLFKFAVEVTAMYNKGTYPKYY